MTTAVLSLDLTARVAKLLPRLATDQQGEVAAVAAAISRTLKAAGHDLHDLAAHVAAEPRTIVVYRERPAEPQHPPSWGAAYGAASPRGRDRALVAQCQQSKRLSDWETAFLASLAQRLANGRDLTPRQRETLNDISAKMGVRT
jgi:membrane-bound lytic murein transglycosylase B